MFQVAVDELDALLPSVLDRAFREELRQQLSYPLVVKSDPAEFYAMQGDMIDYLYTFARQESPDKRLCATSFEFGALGDCLGATVRSLRAIVLENQRHWFGATTQEVRELIERDFAELFFPSEERWRAKAVADARQALRGILGAEGFLS